MLDRKTARGQSLVGAEIGCRRGHLDSGDVDVEFLGGHLRQRGEHTLTQFDFAGTDFNGAVRADAQPVAKPRIGRKGRRQRFGGHEAALRISAAAVSTARTTRLWAPQRHRLSSSAARTSDSDGSAFVASRAAALTTIPDMQ